MLSPSFVRFLALGPMALGLGLAAMPAWAVKPKPIAGAEVFIDMPNVPGTRSKFMTDEKGRFQLKVATPGMYRVVVQMPAPANGPTTAGPAASAAAASSPGAGPLGLRYGSRWGEARYDYGPIKHLTVSFDPSPHSGGSSMEERLVNGRTMGAFVNIYNIDETVKGRVVGAP